VDACRHVVRGARTVVSLATRPVLFALARVRGEAWPETRRIEALRWRRILASGLIDKPVPSRGGTVARSAWSNSADNTEMLG
jgi:hypothetical protein